MTKDQLIEIIESAIKDHCSGSDLYMAALVGAEKIEALAAAKAVSERDGCQICGGTRGGVKGNENRINGILVCDYCHAAKAVEPERQWVELTPEEVEAEWVMTPQSDRAEGRNFYARISAALREKNASTERQPLTDEWIRERCNKTWVFDTVKQWVRQVEAAHGIGGQQ